MLNSLNSIRQLAASKKAQIYQLVIVMIVLFLLLHISNVSRSAQRQLRDAKKLERRYKKYNGISIVNIHNRSKLIALKVDDLEDDIENINSKLNKIDENIDNILHFIYDIEDKKAFIEIDDTWHEQRHLMELTQFTYYDKERNMQSHDQILAIISNIIYARYHSHSYQFYYNPPLENELQQLLNIGYNEKVINNLNDIKIMNFENKVNEIPTYYFDYNSSEYLRNKYFAKNGELDTLNIGYNINDINVAIHFDTLPYIYYVSLIQHILSVNIGKKKNVFHVFCQYHLNITSFQMQINKHIDKKSVDKLYVRYHIDRSLKETINGLIMSDVLIMSRSALSYIAALLSKAKIIYYNEFRYHPLNHWIIVHSNLTPLNLDEQSKFGNWWITSNCSTRNAIQIMNGEIYKNITCKYIK